MKVEKYIPNFLLLIIVIYFAQDALYAGGSLISQIALLFILIISGFYWIKTLIQKKNKPAFYKAWTALLFLNIFGYIFTGDLSNSNHFGEIKNMLLVSLPFYPFYFFSNNKKINKSLIGFFFIMLIVLIIKFYTNRMSILSLRGSGSEDVVNNIAYSFVRLIPFVFLLKDKKVISMIAAFVLLFFIIQGAKRGAMIAGVIGFIIFAYYQIKTIDQKHRIKNIFIITIGVVLLGYYGYEYFQQNEYLIQRLQSMLEGDSSGRDTIYSNLFNAWFNTDSFKVLLFGHGFGSSIFLSGTGNWAHNDWLELLSAFGLLGALVYLSIFIIAVKTPIKYKWKTDKKIMMYAILSIWFFITFVSMYYNNPMSAIQTILLGYLIGSNQKSIT